MKATMKATMIFIVILLSFSCQEKKKPITLKFAHNMNQSSAMNIAAERFKSIVEAKSKGLLKIKIFPNQILGNDHQMLAKARHGQIDILLTPTAKLSLLVASMQIADFPFIFPNSKVALEILNGKGGKMLLDKLDKHGLLGVAFWENALW